MREGLQRKPSVHLLMPVSVSVSNQWLKEVPVLLTRLCLVKHNDGSRLDQTTLSFNQSSIDSWKYLVSTCFNNQQRVCRILNEAMKSLGEGHVFKS